MCHRIVFCSGMVILAREHMLQSCWSVGGKVVSLNGET